MNSKLLIVVLILVFVGAVGTYTFHTRTSDVMEQEAMSASEGSMQDKAHDEAIMNGTSTDTMMNKPDAMMAGMGTYETYAPQKIAMASASHHVVLFFRAGWCPTCRAVDADIKAHLKDIPGNLTILDVNYDASTDLKKKYGVTMQHTFVEVDAQGTLIKKWTGSPTLAAIVGQVK